MNGTVLVRRLFVDCAPGWRQKFRDGSSYGMLSPGAEPGVHATHVMPKRKILLFVLGSLGICISGVWWCREGGYEPLITLVGSVAALIEDYFGSARTVFLRASLKRKSKDELREVLDDFGVSGTVGMTKKELIEATLTAQKHSEENLRRWRWPKWVVLATAFSLGPIIGVSLNKASPLPHKTPPQVSLMWYQTTTSGLQLVSPTNVIVEVAVEEIIANRVRLPLRMAVRNHEMLPLRVVRVELSYPAGVEVRSSGSAKIDPSNRLLVYEHDIGTLENVNLYTPLKEIDVITVPFLFLRDSFVVQTSDGVPNWICYVTGLDLGKSPAMIPLRIRVYSEGRPTAEGLIILSLHSKFQFFTDFETATTAQVSAADRSRWTEPEAADAVDSWQAKLPRTGDLLEYKKATTTVGIAQSLFVNGKLRKLIVDENRDGWLDYTLIDGEGTGMPDHKFVFTNHWPMLEWKESGAR